MDMSYTIKNSFVMVINTTLLACLLSISIDKIY